VRRDRAICAGSDGHRFSGANTRRCVHKRDQTDRSDSRRRNPLAARNAVFSQEFSGRADCFRRKVHRIHLPAGTGKGPDFIACPAARNESFAGLLPRRKSRNAEGTPPKSTACAVRRSVRPKIPVCCCHSSRFCIHAHLAWRSCRKGWRRRTNVDGG
jgi:hypothetical protein